MKWSFLNSSEKCNALFPFNKCRGHVAAVLESLNSFNKRRFLKENVKRKPHFEILSPLDNNFFYLINITYNAVFNNALIVY